MFTHFTPRTHVGVCPGGAAGGAEIQAIVCIDEERSGEDCQLGEEPGEADSQHWQSRFRELWASVTLGSKITGLQELARLLVGI